MSRAKQIIIAAAFILFANCSKLATAQPRLFFSPDDIAQLQQRVKSPDLAKPWGDVLGEANKYCDPDSPSYADPEKVTDGFEEIKILLRGHYFGRRLKSWMENLGLAYHITGEKKYADHAVKLLVNSARQLPVTDKFMAEVFAGGRGDMMRGLACGYDMFNEFLSDEEKTDVLETAAGYVESFITEVETPGIWWGNYHNFNGVCAGPAGCLSILLEDLDVEKAKVWQQKSTAVLNNWLTKGFDKQGAYFEGVAYSLYGLENTFLYADALKRTGGENLFDHPTISKLTNFYVQSLLPGESVCDARNDSGYGTTGMIPLKIAGEHKNSLAKWLWDQYKGGSSFLQILWYNQVTPLSPQASSVPLAEHFIGRGLCTWRTGWDKSDIMFAIEAGPYYPITHNQADKGHFTLYGLGYRWAVDPGYANDRLPNGRAQTVAHNCILIDDNGQALSGAGAGTNGKITAYENNDNYGYSLADCTEAYRCTIDYAPDGKVIDGKVPTIIKNQTDFDHALRHTFFVRPSDGIPAYAIILDDIKKDDSQHKFTWQMLTDTQMQILTQGSIATVTPQSASNLSYVSTPVDAAGKGLCVFNPQIAEAGDYYLWARVQAAATDPGKSDSFIIKLNEKEFDWHMPAVSTWTWSRVKTDKPSFALEPGPIELTFKTRETGAKLDCILLTTDPDFQPISLEGNPGIFVEAEDAALTSPMAKFKSAQSSAAMKLFIDAAGDVTLGKDLYTPGDGRIPKNFLRLRAETKAINPNFAAVLIPLPAEIDPPKVDFNRTESHIEINIKWPKRTDNMIWSPKNGEKPTLKFAP